MKNFILFAGLIFSLVFFTQCAPKNLHSNRRMNQTSGIDMQLKGKETEIGKETIRKIISDYGLYEEEELQEFITEKGVELAEKSSQPQLNYNFKILNTDDLNAFSVPGGEVFLTRGLMVYLNSEAQLAGVLGHEIGHLSAGHSTGTLQKNALLEQTQIAADLINGTLQTAAVTSYRKFDRKAERIADQLGVEYSHAPVRGTRNGNIYKLSCPEIGLHKLV